MSDRYLLDIMLAVPHLQRAVNEAVKLLPAAVTKQHWMANKSAPTSSAAWDSTKHWYWTQEDYDPLIMRMITHLVLLSEAMQCLTTIQQPEPTQKPNLTLVRQGRRQ